MAKVRQGILGGFRGRVGNIVGTGWKGIAVMKSLPLTVANPRTAGQVQQRNKFKTLVKLATVNLAAIVKPLWDRFASNMSGFNAFISANQSAFFSDGTLDWRNMIISRGRMLPPILGDYNVSGGSFTIELTNPIGDRFALPTDNIYLLIMDGNDLKPRFAGQVAQTRGSGSTVNVSGSLQDITSMAYETAIFAAYLRNDGSEVSNSANNG